MGMYDTIIILDAAPAFCCSEGHSLRSFQTKDLAHPSLKTYLIHEGRLYETESEGGDARADEMDDWRIEGTGAIWERRFRLLETQPPRALRAYGHCDECEPVLVRTDRPGLYGDIVNEHTVFVDYRLTFRPGEPLQAERESGNREDLKDELRRRGVLVLEETDALAIAHRELSRARESLERWRTPR